VDANGIITTVAGSGAGAHGQVESGGGSGGGGTSTCPSGLGDNGPATIATMDGPSGMALTSRGNLLIADPMDCRVRSVALPSPLLYSTTSLALNGQSLSATVTPIGGSATPTGTVQFMQYSSYGPPLPLTSATLTGGTATVNLSALTAGTYPVMAVYTGDAVYNGSGSAALTVTGTGGAPPALGVNYSYPPLVSVPVNLMITSTGPRGQPTGTVQVSEGTTVLSTLTLVNGAAQYAYTSSVAGAHQITLQYSGDSNYVPLTWTFTLTLLVPGSVTLTADTNPAIVGAPVTFSATLTPSTATGTVSFLDGGTGLGAVYLANGQASLRVSTLAAGTHSITAAYSGDNAVAQATSNVWSETINAITPTTLSLASSASPSTWNQAVTLTATISPAAATGSINFYDGATPLGSATLSGGIASIATAQLAAGSHSLTAVYTASGSYGGSTSPAVAQTVNKATPAVTLTSSANPAVNPATVTFTASVNPADAGVTVQFLDGQTVLGTSTAAAGTATYSYSSFTPGTHTITAVCQGDGNLNQASSAPLTQTIQAPTTLTVSAPATTVFGQPVTVTASITPAAATGSVQFSDGATAVGTAPIVNGAAPLTLSALAVGAHSIQAAYNGDGTYLASTSAAWALTVNKAPASAALSSSLNPSTAGQAVTLTAAITPAAATGSVQFLDGATAIGTATLSGGTGLLSTTALAAGSHSITAVYSGDSSYLGATSAAVVQAVMAATSTTVSASSGTISYGQNVQLTATVTPASATGTVQFLDGGTALVTLPLVGGAAVVTATNLAVGAHAITAVYSGDANDTGSTSAVTMVTVVKAAATAAISSSTNPSANGQAVVFTATITPATATGSVQFLDGATAIGTAAVSGGTASVSTASLAPGSHSITAVYGGDGNDNAATSAVLTETVSKTPNSTTVSASSGTITYGQNVQLTASVTPATATGTVQFLDGATALATLPLSGGAAVLTATNLAAGTHAFTAVYSGDANNAGGTSPVTTVIVSKAATSAAVASSLNPSAPGQAVVFTATITPATATGSVQFLDGATAIGTATLSGGTASASMSSLAAGSHSITAVYSGDGNYNGATSAVLTETVSKAPTSTTVSASSGTISYGQSVQLTASVTPASATGTLQFLDGATVLATLPLSSGAAVLTATNLTAGTHSITAAYSGDANNAASTSAATTVTVSKAATSAAVASSLNPSAPGQAVTFTATVTPATATGSVQFLDGATAMGTATLSGGTAAVSTASLAAGSHSITAVYSGDANYNGATSAVLPQIVSKASTSTTVSASSGTITYGQSVQLSATVTPSSATGTVQFLDGATVLGTSTVSGGAAVLTVPGLAVGTHTVTAAYSGDANSAGSTSAAIGVTVNKAAASAAVASSLNPSVAGQAVTFTATVAPATATGTVQFLDGATAIGTAALSGGTAALSTSALASGSHSITAVYSGDGNYNGATSAALGQTVMAATTTTLSSNKSTASQGQTVTFTATVSPTAATGNVQFLDGATAIGSVALSGGSAVLSVSNLAVGTHSVTARYGGAAGYASSTSPAVNVTITAALPAAPSNLAATAVSSSQINLTWTASTTPGVAYNVYASAIPGFTPSPGNRIASGVAATSYSHTGLPPSMTLYYLVTAQNANGESAASNQASATTPAAISCHIGYSVTNQWNVGFTAAVTVKNTGPAPINGWRLTWTWPGNQQITQAWNSNYSESGANATLTNASWNAMINPGSTISGIGFNGSYSGSNPNPTAFYVNGTRCQ